MFFHKLVGTSKEDNAYFIDYLGRKNSLYMYICNVTKKNTYIFVNN